MMSIHAARPGLLIQTCAKGSSLSRVVGRMLSTLGVRAMLSEDAAQRTRLRTAMAEHISSSSR
jgi:hypothetical protein